MIRRRWPWALLACLLALCLLPTLGMAGSTTQITSNTYNDSLIQINSNGWMTWQGSDGTDFEIFLYNGTTTIQLTDNAYDDLEPQINDKGWVTWHGVVGVDNEEIFLYNGTSTVRLTNNTGSDINPQINNNGWVTWQGSDGTDYEIFLYNGTTTLQLTNNNENDFGPRINNNGDLTWQGSDGTDAEIFLYKDGATYQLTNNSDVDGVARINNNGWVSWQGGSGINSEIFLYNGNITFRLTNNSYADVEPRINNNGWVSWHGSDGNDDEIFLYNGTSVIQLTNNNETDDSARINDNGWVTWNGRVGADYEIFLYDGAATMQLADNNEADVAPRINNHGWVAWQGHDGTDYEIFLNKPDVTSMKCAYVYGTDTGVGTQFLGLLFSAGDPANRVCMTDIVQQGSLSSQLVYDYNVIIVGYDTAGWTDAERSLVISHGNSVIGIGVGGTNFFSGMDPGLPLLSSGPYFSFFDPNVVRVPRPSGIYPMFQWPYPVLTPTTQLYTASGPGLMFGFPTAYDELILLGGWISQPTNYFTLLQENKYFFWGYYDPPDLMTADGQNLFHNIAFHLAHEADRDIDGLVNAEERVFGTNQWQSDTDNDGVTDINDAFPLDPTETRDSDGAERQITTHSSNQRYPVISGDRIVWEDARNGNFDIYMYDLSTGTETQITTDSLGTVVPLPSISGDRLVWSDERSGNEDIYMYDLSSGYEQRITMDPGPQKGPKISGDRIVWMDNRYSNWDIFMYDLSTGTETQITTNTGNQNWPAISGDRIVWMDQRNGNLDIYMYDISTRTELPISTNSATQQDPEISGDRIVWWDNRNISGVWDTYIYDLSTRTETRLSTAIDHAADPAISGDRVVWGSQNLYMYDLSTSTETQITTHSLGAGWPSISGDRIVWMDVRSGDWDIYLYQGDGIGDNSDNCPDVPNGPDGGTCVGGTNDGGFCLVGEACPFGDCNLNQEDTDADSVGDACDNCPYVYNIDQADTDFDGIGDACDGDYDDDGDELTSSEEYDLGTDPNNNDTDGDAFDDLIDNCKTVSNDQADTDNGTLGDACDNCISKYNLYQEDLDEDGVGSACDNCPGVSNPIAPSWTDINGVTHTNSQPDYDLDGIGDACDELQTEVVSTATAQADTDGDGRYDPQDNCPSVANADQLDGDADNKGNVCDSCPNDPANDSDGDGICGDVDNCPTVKNPDQANLDGDVYVANNPLTGGNACDQDADSDGYISVYFNGNDCNDLDLAINPGVGEIPNDGKDNDCNPATPDKYIVFSFTNPDNISYENWLPDRIGQNATVRVTVPGGTLSGITVTSTSYPGKYTNDASTDSSADFTWNQSGDTATITSNDFGGSVTIRAVATVSGQTFEDEFVIPKDSDRDGLPDKWEIACGCGDMVANGDIDTSWDNTFIGDGLTNFQEYRGFKWGWLAPTGPDATYKTIAYLPVKNADTTMKTDHFRTDPTRKDLFIQYVSYSDTYPFAIGAAFNNARIDVHAVDKNLTTSLGSQEIDPLEITSDTGYYYNSGWQGNIYKEEGIRNWKWDTKGVSGVGDGIFYGAGTRTFQLAHSNYFTQKPYIEQTPGTANTLEPIRTVGDPSFTVEDVNDNGTKDTGEDRNNDRKLNGDLLQIPTKTCTYPTCTLNKNLSPFDIDKDGNVELPVIALASSIDPNYEYTWKHALKSTITHELGHAVGIYHTAVYNCVMGNVSGNWSRDHTFSAEARSQIQIHNQ
jgi:beta propeller repeat protein